MKKMLLCIASLIFTVLSYAQRDSLKTSNKFKFRSLATMGILKGELSDPELQVQSINGLEYINWLLGVGAGIDFYESKSVPIFIDIRRSLIGSVNKFFMYGDAGINVPLKKDEKWGAFRNTYEKGKYYDVGIGYSITTLKKAEYLISLGYTLKEMVNQTKYSYTDNGVLYQGDETKRTYENRRIILKFGWKF